MPEICVMDPEAGKTGYERPDFLDPEASRLDFSYGTATLAFEWWGDNLDTVLDDQPVLSDITDAVIKQLSREHSLDHLTNWMEARVRDAQLGCLGGDSAPLRLRWAVII